MKIDYVVIASDSNPLYTDFYVPVSKAWNHFGYKTFMLEICDEDSDIFETEYGIYKKVKSISDNTGLQSQVVRLFASKFLENKNLLMSDIDMMPLSIDYFESNALPILEDEILAYTGQPYGVNPFYPMCYILGNSDIISEALGINDISFEDFISYLSLNYKGDTKWGTIWNTDENFLYDMINGYDKLKVMTREQTRMGPMMHRVDRVNWNYNPVDVSSGKYIDSHLVRPYSKYKSQVDALLKLVLEQ